MDREQLLELKNEIEESRTEMAKLQTRKTIILEQLEKDYGCKSLSTAEKLHTSKKKEINKLNSEIDKGLEDLENERQAQ